MSLVYYFFWNTVYIYLSLYLETRVKHCGNSDEPNTHKSTSAHQFYHLCGSEVTKMVTL